MWDKLRVNTKKKKISGGVQVEVLPLSRPIEIQNLVYFTIQNNNNFLVYLNKISL